jgi:hypothetical protein
MFFSRSLEPSNSIFSLVSCNSLIRSFNMDWVNLDISLSYWCGSKYISSVCDCKELLSDSPLKLSGALGTGKSGPWGTGRIADKRFGYVIPFFCCCCFSYCKRQRWPYKNSSHRNGSSARVIAWVLQTALPSAFRHTSNAIPRHKCCMQCEVRKTCLDHQLSIGTKKNIVSSQTSLFNAPWYRTHNFHRTRNCWGSVLSTTDR